MGLFLFYSHMILEPYLHSIMFTFKVSTFYLYPYLFIF